MWTVPKCLSSRPGSLCTRFLCLLFLILLGAVSVFKPCRDLWLFRVLSLLTALQRVVQVRGHAPCLDSDRGTKLALG